MRVYVLCEFSGIVRDAFIARGHDAVSVDLLPSERLGPHLQCDARSLNYAGVDMVIAHPPCTRLAVSGARWFAAHREEQDEALAFVRWIFALPVPRLCLENPVSIISTHIRRPDQIIQPYYFGHCDRKTTCLWLRGLPPLMATCLVRPPAEFSGHRLPPSPDRPKIRSRTFSGIAFAMAAQWG